MDPNVKSDTTNRLVSGRRRFGTKLFWGIAEEMEFPTVKKPAETNPPTAASQTATAAVEAPKPWVKNGVNGTDELMSREEHGSWRVAGYWRQAEPHQINGLHYPTPIKNDSEWKGQAAFCEKLRKIQTSGRVTCGGYFGSSFHRIEGGTFTSPAHSSYEYKDYWAQVMWPAALLDDYIIPFNVRPPDEFIEYVMSFKLDGPVADLLPPREQPTVDPWAAIDVKDVDPSMQNTLKWIKSMSALSFTVEKQFATEHPQRIKYLRESTEKAVAAMEKAVKAKAKAKENVPTPATTDH